MVVVYKIIVPHKLIYREVYRGIPAIQLVDKGDVILSIPVEDSGKL